MCETLISCEEHCVGTVGELQKQAPYCMKMGAYRSAPRRPKEVQAEGEEAPARLPLLTCAQGTAIAQTLSYSLADAHSVYRHKDEMDLILCYLSTL